MQPHQALAKAWALPWQPKTGERALLQPKLGVEAKAGARALLQPTLEAVARALVQPSKAGAWALGQPKAGAALLQPQPHRVGAPARLQPQLGMGVRSQPTPTCGWASTRPRRQRSASRTLRGAW